MKTLRCSRYMRIFFGHFLHCVETGDVISATICSERV